MENFQLQNDWTTFLNRNEEGLLRFLQLTNGVLKKLRNEEVLPELDFQRLHAISELRNADRVTDFLEILRGDVVCVDFQKLITILLQPANRCVSAGNIFKEFAAPRGLYTEDPQPPSIQRHNIQSPPPAQTAGTNTNVLSGSQRLWHSQLESYREDLLRNTEILDMKQLPELSKQGVITQEQFHSLLGRPQVDMNSRVLVFLDILADLEVNVAHLDKLIQVFRDPIKPKTSKIFRDIKEYIFG